MLVIPKKPENPYTWKAQLFVTPSKIIIQSVIALLGKDINFNIRSYILKFSKFLLSQESAS